MGVTLDEIRKDVRSRVGDSAGELTNSLLNHWANIGQTVVFNQLYPVINTKLTDTALIDTVAGTAKYSIPATCRQIRRVKLNGKKTIEKSIDDIDSINNTFDSATANEPVFLEWGGKVELAPVSAIQTGTALLQIDFIKQTVNLTNDTDKSIIPEEYHGLIIDYVEMLALRKLGRADKSTSAEQTIAKMFTDIINANTQSLERQMAGVEKKQ